MAVTDIELRHFGACALAGVSHFEGHFIGARHGARLDGEFAVTESGVGQAVAESERRRHAVVFVAAIAHEHAVAIHHAARAGIGIVAVVRRVILPAFLDADGQAPGGVHLAQQDFRQRSAARLAGIPGLNHARNVAQPAVHVHAAAGRDDDYGLFVDGGDLAD